MSSGETTVVVVTLTQSDYAKALNAMASENAKWAKRILFWISIAILIYMIYNLVSLADDWAWRVGLVTLLSVLLVVLAKYAFPYWSARSFVKKNQDKLGPNRFEIGPDGASYQSPHGEGKLAWTAFHQIRETTDFFLLYTQSNFAQIVPKRCFASQSDVTAYREVIRKYYKGKMDLLN